MEKLTIKELAPYLPYGLKIFSEDGNSYDVITDIQIAHIIKHNRIGEVKPILRPLSDLTKEIKVNGEKFVPIEYFELGDDYNESVDYGNGNIKLIGLLKDMAKYNFIDSNYMPYYVVQKLFEWHFDVFGLIEKRLAIDINTL